MAKKTQEYFENKVREAHGENYDLSEAVYEGAIKPVIVTCTLCGTRKPINANNLYSGQPCKSCILIARNKAGLKTTEQFIIDSKRVHGEGRYLYNKTVYINNTTEVIMYCTVCKKDFPKQPHNHLHNAQGCPDCGHANAILKNTKTHAQFLFECTENNPSTISFEKSFYVDSRVQVIATCSIHGDFPKYPFVLSQGCGCPTCNLEQSYINSRCSFEEFQERAIKKHHGLYKYVKETYIRADDYVEIICEKHGKFIQNGSAHLSGAGCNICKNSQGELHTHRHLQSLGYTPITQKYFKECRDKGALLFDFYIPELEWLIEYHGRQHYEFVEFFHKTLQGFEDRLRRDLIKKTYAEKNHNFLEIPYWDFENIEKLIGEKIKSLTNPTK
jgi:hypothetical protein